MSEVIDLRELAEIPIPELTPTQPHNRVPIEECGEPLVAVRDYGDERNRIVDASIYSGGVCCSPYVGKHKLSGFNNLAWARLGLAEILTEKIQPALPLDHSLVAFDIQRPNKGQGSLWTLGRSSMDDNPKYADWSESEKDEYAKGFVLPSWNEEEPDEDEDEPATKPNHPCAAVFDGGVLILPEGVTREDPGWQDLALRHGRLLNFGSAFDTADETSATRHFEELLEAGHKLTPKQQEALESRRQLAHLFVYFGDLVLRPTEYWEGTHPLAQYGIANDSKPNNGVAIYDIADLTEEQKAYDARCKVASPIPTPGIPLASRLLIT